MKMHRRRIKAEHAAAREPPPCSQRIMASTENFNACRRERPQAPIRFCQSGWENESRLRLIELTRQAGEGGFCESVDVWHDHERIPRQWNVGKHINKRKAN